MVITFLPFAGFGAYIDDSNPDKLKCVRYRDAAGMANRAYSIFFMIFGSYYIESGIFSMLLTLVLRLIPLQAACWFW